MQVVCKRGFHGLCVFEEREGVDFYAFGDKGFDFGEGVRILDVAALHGGFDVRGGIGGLGEAPGVEGVEVED